MPGNQYFVVMPMQHCVGIPQSARNPANVSLLFQEFSRLNQGAPALLLSLAQMAPLVFWIGTILGYNSALTVCVFAASTPLPCQPCPLAYGHTSPALFCLQLLPTSPLFAALKGCALSVDAFQIPKPIKDPLRRSTACPSSFVPPMRCMCQLDCMDLKCLTKSQLNSPNQGFQELSN